MDAHQPLERGREMYRRRAWGEAYKSLSLADQAAPLGAADLWLLAMSAHLTGRDDDSLDLLERAHRAHLEAGETEGAARCLFWLGFRLANRGDMGQATGWFARAQRLLERGGRDCVEFGYLLLPVMEQHFATGNYEALDATAAQVTGIAERFGDEDLLAMALHAQGRGKLRRARIDEGLAQLDEAMVLVTAGELSPLVTGVIYCSVLSGCQEVYALRRAQEWTAALSQWCESQPDMVPFSGQCLVHRAEIMQFHGAWRDALVEARLARDRCAQADEKQPAAAAYYQQGEVHRLLGDYAAAEEAYREARQLGREPQPGLALLWMAQGNHEAAVTAIQRVVGETTRPLKRARLLPAYIEIMLAAGEIDEARAACQELEETVGAFQEGVMDTALSHARGAVELAGGDGMTALVALRRAWQGWQELEAPYEAARARVLLGLACRALGDEDTAVMEIEAARDDFERLGAAPDKARADSLVRAENHRTGDQVSHGLTPRELEVLRLVAAGTTNKAIAAELSLSERTVDRHVSNIFNKLSVNSRAAATAYAYKHQLV